MFTRSFLIGALALTAAEAFAPGPAMIRPTRAPRAASARPLRMQTQEDSEIAEAKAQMSDMGSGDVKGQSQGPQSVSTGGTQYSSQPKSAPLFLIPANSVCGDSGMVGDKGFDPLGFATSMENKSNSSKAAARRVSDCRPLPPTPSSNALPSGSLMTRQMRLTC